jgi:beta-glucosidase
VDFELRARDLSFFSPFHDRWVLESGEFEIGVGASSRDLRQTATVAVDAPPLTRPLSWESPLKEWLDHPVGGQVIHQTLGAMEGSSVATEPEILAMVESLPLNRLITMSGGRLNPELIDRFLEQTTNR